MTHPCPRISLALSTAAMLLLAACQPQQEGWYGMVERDRHTLNAPASELIAEVLVREGEHVQAGQLLLRLDDRAASARVTRALAQLAEAEALHRELRQGPRQEALAQARAAFTGAEASALDARQRLERARQLLGSGAGTLADLEHAQASHDMAHSALEQARERIIELENGTRPEQLQQAEARVTAASANLELERKLQEDMSLLAAHDGVINSLPWRSGDRVNQGSTLVNLLIDDEPYVRVYLPAQARSTLNEGDSLQVVADGQPAFTATIRHIHVQPAYTPYYALNERDRTRLMYLAELSLPEHVRELPAGLIVEVVLP